MKRNSRMQSCRRRGVSRERHRGALPLAGGCNNNLGVTAGKAGHNTSNARAVTAGKMGRNSSNINDDMYIFLFIQ